MKNLLNAFQIHRSRCAANGAYWRKNWVTGKWFSSYKTFTDDHQNITDIINKLKERINART